MSEHSSLLYFTTTTITDERAHSGKMRNVITFVHTRTGTSELEHCLNSIQGVQKIEQISNKS